MTEQNVSKVQEALTVVAQVCDVHVATAADHRVIAASLKIITDSLSTLIKENYALQQQVKRSQSVDKPETEKVECGAV